MERVFCRPLSGSRWPGKRTSGLLKGLLRRCSFPRPAAWALRVGLGGELVGLAADGRQGGLQRPARLDRVGGVGAVLEAVLVARRRPGIPAAVQVATGSATFGWPAARTLFLAAPCAATGRGLHRRYAGGENHGTDPHAVAGF